jgi:peptidoglycan/xylan/chitin deacetylase (PgdA/CDA1 family)/SAM-dependent methyltransferase
MQETDQALGSAAPSQAAPCGDSGAGSKTVSDAASHVRSSAGPGASGAPRPRAYRRLQLSISDLAGLGALQLALLLWLLVDLRLAAAPLALYVAVTAVAPFFPRWSYFLPVISHGPRTARRVALTFDDGPDPATTPALLSLLAERGLRATFFLVGERIRRHPELAAAIRDAGHELGNHSHRHDPLLMLRGRRRLAADVAECQAALAACGVRTRAFRPPAGLTNPRLRGALSPLGLQCVTFDCRARDAGNRRVAGLARRLLRRVRPGSIVLLHDREPHTRGDPRARTDPQAHIEAWLDELRALLAGLKERGLEPVTLGTLLETPIHLPLDPPGRNAGTPPDALAADLAADPVRDFYDGLAPRYDEEQESGGGSALRATERRRVLETLAALPIDPATSHVLELGAGTGRFTAPLAQRADRVVAVDLSPGMLARLQQRLALPGQEHNRKHNHGQDPAHSRCDPNDRYARSPRGLSRVQPLAADLTALPLRGRPFDLICAFSTLEYVPDLPTTLRQLAAHLAPGGTLYLTTAHRCLFRRFVQLGHALRQGVWLHAYRRRALAHALRAAGLEVQLLRTHHLRLGPFGGLLLEARATQTQRLPSHSSPGSPTPSPQNASSQSA